MPKYYSFLDNDMPGPSKPKPKKVGPAAKRPRPARAGGSKPIPLPSARKPKPAVRTMTGKPAAKAPTVRKYPEGYVKPSRVAGGKPVRTSASKRKMK